MTWEITYHAGQKEALLSHRPITDVPLVRKELARVAAQARIVRYRPNGRVEMRAEGYWGKLIGIPAQGKVVTVTPLD